MNDDILAAYHEAGHVIAAYEFGWTVDRGGVRIGPEAGVRLRRGDGLDGERASVIITLAAWVAEARVCDQRSIVAYDYIVDWVERMRGMSKKEMKQLAAVERTRQYGGGDDFKVSRALLKAHPRLTGRGARKRVARFERETIALLDRPETWSKVMAVAEALLRKRQLSRAMVEKLLPGHYDPMTVARLTERKDREVGHLNAVLDRSHDQ